MDVEKVKPGTALLRLRDVCKRTGVGRSTLYVHMQRGLMPRPIKVAERVGALPDYEVDEIVAARIRGATEDEIRALVSRLEAARVAA
jgi:prophage regulatory protein